MISVANRWQSEIRKPANGTTPAAAGFGSVVTADAVTHTKGAWVDIVAAADWSGFTGDAFEIEINFNNCFTSGAIVRALADIGVDSGGGYTSIIDNLAASFASNWNSGSNGITYRFPLRIASGVKVGCRVQSNVTVQTVSVGIVLRGNPTNPGLLRAGTFVRTFGADTANSQGAAITTGTGAEGNWFQMSAATADDLWFWDVGYSNNDAAFSNGGMHIDLGSGVAASEVQFAQGFVFSKNSTEALGKLTLGAHWQIASGSRIAARMQSQGGETTETLIVYGVGGSHELADAATATGTVTISGSPAANGKTVTIFAVDADGVVELIGTTTTSGGAGGFSLGCPDITRSYFARYQDGSDIGCSALGIPGTNALNITIGGAGGGTTLVANNYDGDFSMRKNEATAADRVAGPIPFRDLDGALASGLSFAGAECQVRSSTGVYANSANSPVDNGDGTYRLQFSQAETNVDSFAMVKLTKAGYPTQYFATPIRTWQASDSALLATIAGYLDTEIAAIIASLGSLASSVGSITTAVGALPTAIQIRDAILTYALRPGRTVRGHWRRMDGLLWGKVTGLLGALVTAYQPGGVTPEFTAAQDTTLGTRDEATVTNSETP